MTTLREDILYLGDNGRATCGALQCAGATAHYTGHDLSGQPMEPVTPQDAIRYGFRCETCGMQPRLVSVQ